jgi:membrane associated rhomboid family serine protease
MSFQEFKPRQFQQLPMVVKNILIINVVLFVASRYVLKDIPFDNYLNLHYFKSSLFKPHQFITYMFMHGDERHILFNMLAVYMFGSILENMWGPKRFLNFYILCGLGAALAQYLAFYFQSADLLNSINTNYAPDIAADYRKQLYDGMSCLGASGSVFGLLVAFAMMFPNTHLNIYFLIPVKAKYLVIGYGLFELITGFLNRSGDNVGHFAHLGGLIVGVIIMLIWKRNKTFFF